jgi:hypothetical protein
MIGMMIAGKQGTDRKIRAGAPARALPPLQARNVVDRQIQPVVRSQLTSEHAVVPTATHRGKLARAFRSQ